LEDAGIPVEEAEDGRFVAVVDAEAAGEAAVGGEAVPALADEGRAGEGRGLRREAEEDLGEEVVVVQRRLHRPRTGAAAEAPHLALSQILWNAMRDVVDSNVSDAEDGAGERGWERRWRRRRRLAVV
jgi:hypothetical protein